ncbi:MAG: NADH-quinone oxidoreductase subunit J [Amphritea sp.]
MTFLFYGAAAIALFCTLMVITRTHAVHALLYLIVAQLAVALIFFLLGAPFAAALEILVYAGAIMVMFIFVIMMLNLGRTTSEREKNWLPQSIWLIPAVLCGALLLELLFALEGSAPLAASWVGPKTVGITLFGPYLLAVELASMLLLAGLVGAYHLARPYLKRTARDENTSPGDYQTENFAKSTLSSNQQQGGQ